MQTRELARPLVKAAGLVLLVHAMVDLLKSIGRVLSIEGPVTLVEGVAMSLAPAFLSILAGLGMVWGAGRIAERALIDSAPAASSAGIDAGPLLRAAIAVLGLYFIADGLGESAYYWGRAELFQDYWVRERFTKPTLSATDFAGILAGAARLLAGSGLFLGSSGIARLQAWLASVRGRPWTDASPP
jgi:hypothetical protein